MKLRFSALIAILFVVTAVVSFIYRAPTPAAPNAKPTLALEAPPKAKPIQKHYGAPSSRGRFNADGTSNDVKQPSKLAMKAVFKVEGKADQEIVMPQVYEAPPNTPADHCLLVPHQVLDQEITTAAVAKPEHSLLAKKTCRREGHANGTCRQNRNSGIRLGGFGF
jgi:hypothetical protein